MSTVHLVAPAGIDDPQRPTGGNVYDRRVCRGLGTLGWRVHEHLVSGRWPWPDAAARRELAQALDAVPGGGLALLDGLLASAVPDVLAPHSSRLRLVVLQHMPLGAAEPGARPRERDALRCATAVVTPSQWARRWLLTAYRLPPTGVHVAHPGADPASLARGTAGQDNLLCVAAVTPHKGHDVLVDALIELRDVPWICRLAGALDVAPGFVGSLRRRVGEYGIADRVDFVGPLTRADLEAAYAGADALVLGSRVETYGIVVAEALAHGLPVIGTAVGGVPEAVGRASDGRRPGVLVAPDDAAALGEAMRGFLTDGRLRAGLREAAADRGRRLPRWSHTADLVAHVLSKAASTPDT